MKTYHSVTLLGLLLVAPIAIMHAAPDLNGYEAQYECRAGNPNCNVDVVALGQRQCEQTITPSMAWSSIDWSRNTICIAAGDHTGKGTLRIQSGANGSSSNYKVIRYYRDSDTDDEPWNQSPTTRATVAAVRAEGNSYWVIHRLSFLKENRPPSDNRIYVDSGSSNVIVSRNLIEGRPLDSGDPIYAAVGCWWPSDCTSLSKIVIQNNVIRHNAAVAGTDPVGIAFDSGTDIWVVNNEIYDWPSHPHQNGQDASKTTDGYVIENNDIYFTPAVYTAGGTLMRAEGTVETKGQGSQTKPIIVSQNRIWGNRWSDTDECCIGGTAGAAINFNATDGLFRWMLVQNNILIDNLRGIQFATGITEQASVIGNIIYQTREYYEQAYAIESIKHSNAEFYFNTIIDVGTGANWAYVDAGTPNDDFRANVLIDAQARTGGAPADSTIYDDNVFYNTQSYAANGSNRNVIESIAVRMPGVFYPLGAVVRGRTSGSGECTGVADPDCYLYRAIAAGNSAPNPEPNWATELGATFADGEVAWQAIRGPYGFYRRLKTGPEEFWIPYASVHASAPEVGFTSNIGARSNIGINDDLVGSGILASDRTGVLRMGTAGALEAGGAGGGSGGQQTPYGGTARPIPGLIEAEHFDDGADGIAYHDTTTANEGAAFRSTGVDLESSSENGYNIGWTQSGEWVAYSVNVAATSTYRIDVRVASAGPGGVLHVEIDSVDVTGPLTVPDTGGWQNWQTLTRDGVMLTAGSHILRLAFDTAGTTGDIGNVNYINITQAGSTPPPPCYTPYLGAAINIPGTIEAEHYDLGGENCAYHDTTPQNEGGGIRPNEAVDTAPAADVSGDQLVGWVTAGEWLQYSVDVATADIYTLEIRYATQGFGGNMHIEFDGQDKTGSIALPDTGGWLSWQTITVTGVVLDAGPQNMRVRFDTAGPDGWLANINYIHISAGTPQPSLSGSLAVPPAVINLTTDGPSDWVHWGLIDEISVNRKSGVTPLISNYTPIGTGAVQQYNDNPSGFSWTDGTPTTNITNTTTYLYLTGIGNGFEVSVPADTTLQTAKVYVGVWAAQGQLTATLSDNSASGYTDSSLNHPADHSHGIYTFQYRAASAGQSLVIRWRSVNSYHPEGSVTWQAVAVGGG